MFKRAANDKKVSLWKAFKRKLSRTQIDKDILELIETASNLNEVSLRNIPIDKIRSTYIESNFNSATDLIDSMKYMISSIGKLDNFDRSTFSILEKREIEFEKWIELHLANSEGIAKINFELIYLMKTLKKQLEFLIIQREANKHSYYKRLSKIYFQEFKTWLDLMNELIQTKKS